MTEKFLENMQNLYNLGTTSKNQIQKGIKNKLNVGYFSHSLIKKLSEMKNTKNSAKPLNIMRAQDI
jgi:hypothetical protein